MYAKHIHWLGSCVHLIYFIMYFLYVDHIYLYKTQEDHRLNLCWAMLICLLYPLCYDSMQMFKIGVVDYFADPWNYID